MDIQKWEYFVSQGIFCVFAVILYWQNTKDSKSREMFMRGLWQNTVKDFKDALNNNTCVMDKFADALKVDMSTIKDGCHRIEVGVLQVKDEILRGK